ncbi:hypothetical protein HPC38_06445 [Pasteurellaceae bacterium HPA106]|uniref:hypothetical protein n=1 Tax=Spirabiliibacterium pneumoniae TaxID=221400 RepID=UPI001AADD42E|nr:hypothetical protein [Spirabiliibacterium pneumoniae]MBE2896513.1 hypothetical protein [Spirabiliibacterium pneumoniae]
MPHINIKSYPKNLTKIEFDNFISELNTVIQRYLKASDDVISIHYTEVTQENWHEVYNQEIKPNLKFLAKKPNYEM